MSKPKAVKGTKKTAKAKQIEIPMEGKGVAAQPTIPDCPFLLIYHSYIFRLFDCKV